MEDRKQNLALAYLKLLSKAIKLEFDIDTPTPVDQTITFVDILDRTTPKKENDELLEDLPSPPLNLDISNKKKMSLEDFEEIVANVEISATSQVLKDGIMADRNFDISPILNTKISLKANQRLSDEDEELSCYVRHRITPYMSIINRIL